MFLLCPLAVISRRLCGWKQYLVLPVQPARQWGETSAVPLAGDSLGFCCNDLVASAAPGLGGLGDEQEREKKCCCQVLHWKRGMLGRRTRQSKTGPVGPIWGTMNGVAALLAPFPQWNDSQYRAVRWPDAGMVE